MPRELVTKAGRFYCVSLTPDICKTPVGSATPPIPYTIKGEFSQATGVSKNVRSNGEQVVIHASTVVPSVTGDEPGTAKGIKSGTTGKRVQHDQKSSTVSINGERAIREGDTVFMNDKNTKGKVLERGGGGSADTSFGDKFDAAMDKAANAIGATQDSVSEQIGRAAQTKVGRYVVERMEAAVDAGEIKYLSKAAEDMKSGMMDWAVKKNNRAAGAAASVGVALVEVFMPTNALDIVPGPGKLMKWASKGAKAARKAAKTKKAAIPSKDPVPAPKALGAITPKGMPSKTNNAPPAKGSDGGKSRGKGKKEKKDKPSNCCPKNAGPGGKRTSSKHPVHFGTGEEVLQQIDFALGSVIPIVWARCYRSGSETEDWSILGARWASPYTAHLSISRKGIVYHDDTGRSLRLPLLDPGQEFDHRGEGFVLARTDDQAFTLTWRDGSRDRFRRDGTRWLPHGYDGVNGMLPPEPAELCERFSLCRSEDAAGRGLDIDRFHASGEPVLLRVRTDDGRVVEAMRRPRARNVETDLISHVDEVRPDGQRVCHVRYEFVADPDDSSSPLLRRHDLVSQTDRSGTTRHYRYSAHLLTAYTTYGGFEHRLEWISLAALRQRWDGSPLPDGALAELHPITVENSYQARATATRTADGRDEVTIDYLDEDTTRVTEPCGTVFDYTFDENWLAVNVALVPPDGAPPRTLGTRVWDRDGMLIEETDALFRTWRYCYDQAGNLVANTNAEDHTTLLDYDERNRPIRITDALGNATAYEYDASGNLASVTNALGHTTRFEYDAQGRVIAQVDAKGGRTLYSYDTAGRLRSHTDCSGFRSYYRYDADDNLTTTLDALEQETAYTYDVSGQVTTITQPDGTQDHYTYDAAGNLVMHTDALGYQTQYRYDGHGMPTERINALGHSVKYRYDAALRLVELINGNGESYCYSYTPEGWLATETGYDGKVTEYYYDRAGQLSAYESCGIVIQLERDRMGRLILKTTPDGLTRYQYDALGRLTAVTAPHAENGFVYDAIGQLLEEHSAYFISEPCPEAYKLRRVPDHYFVMRYGYDELGNRIQTILPDGHRIDVLRYGSGHWHGVLWDGAPVVDVERDRLHRERRRQIGPANMKLVATRTYDAQSRMTMMTLAETALSYQCSVMRNRVFTYDKCGNLLSSNDTTQNGDSVLASLFYEFDEIGRLRFAKQPGLEERFKFDSSDTIVNSSFAQARHSPILIDSPIPQRDSIDRQYSKAGSLIRKTIHASSGQTISDLSLVYDAEQRVTQSLNEFSTNKIKCRYLYDAFNRRISKISQEERQGLDEALSTGTSTFIWSGDILQRESNRDYCRTFIYEPDSFISLGMLTRNCREASNDDQNLQLHLCDISGIPRDVIDCAGGRVLTLRYAAWGRVLHPTDRLVQPIRFLGQYEDLETGLYYNRHRYYDPEAGEYITHDPLGIAPGLNPYQYVSNPLQWGDPLGLTKCKIVNAIDEIASLPQLHGKLPSQIRKILKSRGYTMVGSHANPSGANTGGQVWTKAMPDGNTVGVRIDPAKERTPPLERADEVPHAHKEYVPTKSVEAGNYGGPGKPPATLCNDMGKEVSASQFSEVHIKIKKGRLKNEKVTPKKP